MASKNISRLAVAALVLGLLPFGAASAQAADATGPFTITCDTDANVSSSTLTAFGANRVVSAPVGATFTISNDAGLSGSPNHECLLDLNSVISSTEDPDNVIPPGGAVNAVQFEILASGTFTIASNTTGQDAPGTTITVDACSLDGSGIAADPWRVSSVADFQNIGNTTAPESCTLGGHYLQTTDLVLGDFANDQVPGDFSGVYDGDHYLIDLGRASGMTSDWDYDVNPRTGGTGPIALFPSVVGGTIKRLRVLGEITSGQDLVGGIAGEISGGAILSEVWSSVIISSNNPHPEIGGIVAKSDFATKGDYARIQYSKSSAAIAWDPTVDSSAPAEGVARASASIGGLIGLAGGNEAADNQIFEIRDSYSEATIRVDSTDISNTLIYLGGLAGAQGSTFWADEFGLPIGGRVTPIRTYSVATAIDECETTCATPGVFPNNGGPAGNIGSGALFGFKAFGAPNPISSFFLRSGLFQAAVGMETSTGTLSWMKAYVNATLRVPSAVPLSASLLKTITTYQSKGVAEGESVPDPGAPLGEVSSNSTFNYRWAIETTNVETFVPSTYFGNSAAGEIGDETDYEDRALYAAPDPSNPAIYLTRRATGTTDLTLVSAHGGDDLAESSDYPLMGRVWEICDNGQYYPTLVWEEEESCPGGGGGSSGGTSSPSTADLALAAGLTEAEYAAFLASGLTLEQFKAARLAATGPNGALLVGGGSLTLLFLAAGAAILVALRRERRLGRL